MEVKKIVIHCSATPPESDIGRKEINDMHLKRGFRMIGYHNVVRRNGIVEAGRPLDDDNILEEDEVGAHAKGFNRESISICIVGGIDSFKHKRPIFNFTHTQMLITHGLISEYKKRWPHAEVIGHRDLPGVTKACPCFDVRSWYGTSKNFTL